LLSRHPGFAAAHAAEPDLTLSFPAPAVLIRERPVNGRAERCRARAFFDASGALTASPVAAAEVDSARLDAIRDARVLSDGRLLFLADGALGEDATLFVVFREIDGRWLIDWIGQIGEFPELFPEGQ
jgi:hypothetical protein